MQEMTEQHVVGDPQSEHYHEAVVHTHDHYHVSHHHRTGEVFGVFDHRARYHAHKHDHAELVHGHADHDEQRERREHDDLAHTHYHAAPSGDR